MSKMNSCVSAGPALPRNSVTAAPARTSPPHRGESEPPRPEDDEIGQSQQAEATEDEELHVVGGRPSAVPRWQ